MHFRHRTVGWSTFAAGLLLGLLAAAPGSRLHAQRVAVAQPAQRELATELATLRAEVERLKSIAADQAHAMRDVDYHFTNLWFAGEARNWPLADFYWKETLSHLRWAVRIIPVRKDSAGKEIKLQDILESIENSPFMKMGDVIEKQDQDKFETTYRFLLEGCYGCHKAVEKPFLRPRIPEHSATSIINFDPQATWPK